mmetsp:Transcript_5986/g.7816  ORF Transcript_5986/g.7816 Transcript_5986/m.7816 type:complete len:141 (+) Transcript_5986:501-923(+)
MIAFGPKILCIHFKRFRIKFENGLVIGEKDTSRIDLESFEQIKEFDSKNCPESSWSKYATYKLFGIVCHKGKTLGNGHYVAYVRGNDNVNKPECVSSGNDEKEINGSSQWYFASDDEVRQVSREQALGAEAYIAFFHRQD